MNPSLTQPQGEDSVTDERQGLYSNAKRVTTQESIGSGKQTQGMSLYTKWVAHKDMLVTHIQPHNNTLA